MQTRLKGEKPYEFGESRWVQDVPCKKYDKSQGKWIALDWKER